MHFTSISIPSTRRIVLIAGVSLGLVHAVSAQVVLPKSSKATVHDTKPFDTNLSDLPVNYRGNDFVALHQALLRRPIKETYETTADFESRKATWRGKPLVGSFSLENSFAASIPIGMFERKYDADAELFTIHLKPDSDIDAGDSNNPFVSLSRSVKNFSAMSGQTAMGVKFSYSRSSFEDFGLKFYNSNVNSHEWKFPVAREIAKSSDLWSVLFVCNLVEPWTFSVGSHHAPRLDARYEILGISNGVAVRVQQVWLFQPTTGKVYGKLIGNV